MAPVISKSELPHGRILTAVVSPGELSIARSRLSLSGVALLLVPDPWRSIAEFLKTSPVNVSLVITIEERHG